MPVQKLLAELESAYSAYPDYNVDYEVSAKYYDSNLVNFYKSKIWQACYRFGYMNESADIINSINWDQILTNTFVACEQTDLGAVCKDLPNTRYIKDVYYDLAACVYKYGQDLDTADVETVQQWLIEYNRYKLKPFFMSHIIGIQIADNRDDFIIAKENIKAINWSMT